MKTSITKSMLTVLLLLLGSMAGSAYGQLFVVTNDVSGLHNCAILKYDFDGTYLDTILLPNNDARSIAVSGTNIYVACFGLGTVAKYSTDGATINPALISGLTQPSALAVNGTNLFVASVNFIGKYNTDGTTNNQALIATPSGNYGLGSYGMVIIGTNLFASYPSGNLAKYSTDGAIVNETLVTGLSAPGGLTTDGTNIFVANWNNGTQPGWVGEYTTEGSPVAIQLISALNGGAVDLAFGEGRLYVVYGGRSTIGKFTTIGTAVNASLITGGHYFSGVAVNSNGQTPVFPPAVGIMMYSNQPVVLWPDNGGKYILETTTNLVSGTWTAVTNYASMTGAWVTNVSSPAFFRLR